MRKNTLPILVMIMAGQVDAFGADADDVVPAAERGWAKAVMAMDFAAMKEIYSDDLIYAHSTGVIETKKEYLSKLKQGTQKYDLIEHERTTVKSFGKCAIAHSIVRMKGISAGEPFDSKLMMIHFWVVQRGKWRLAAHQTTKLMDY